MIVSLNLSWSLSNKVNSNSCACELSSQCISIISGNCAACDVSFSSVLKKRVSKMSCYQPFWVIPENIQKLSFSGQNSTSPTI